ncbi:sensor histidine kinase [Xanthocytophaga agilis]|uniref:Histidine kinase n=1 Tax=Xanthocytophaga agilis TaxID=3048010 RepID=A0AAE3UEY2_9BACT|nr:histidine kinase [Xanthocytophaga agilis]MDJ1500013.1 histidine kinase [Xanthocytophaga agilis]
MKKQRDLLTYSLLWRLLSIAILAEGIYLVLDLIFSLRYRNYQIQWLWNRYLLYFVLASCIILGTHYIQRLLNIRFPWDKSVRIRFLVQFFSYTLWVLLLSTVIRNGIFKRIIYSSSMFINLDDEIIINSVATFTVLAIVSLDLGVFLLNKWRYSLVQIERFKKENIEFHLEMLKTQVNPHFLFNNLNTLSSLIYTNQDTAAEFVRQLAKVYRYVLENRTKELVTLQEELNFLQSYIYLMDLRFGNNLRIHTQLPDSLHTYAIAPLTLQMLIENAIKHNIVSQKKPFEIRIFQEQSYLIIQNPLQLKPVKEFSSQIGLKNIRSRYRFITDQAVEIIDDGIHFTVKIPLLEGNYSFTEQPAIL